MSIRITLANCAFISMIAFPVVSHSQTIDPVLSLMLGFPVVTDSTTPSEPGTVNYLLDEFSEMTDIQRERWQENNEWAHHVSGKCRVHEVTTTNWMSEIKPSEAAFEVDCRISSDEHVILFYEQSHEDEMYSLSKDEVVEFEGKLKTIKHWGFWNSAYVLVGFQSNTDTAADASDPLWIKKVEKVISVFDTQKKTEIAEIIDYPIERLHPLENIINKQDFLESFDEVFTSEDIIKIASSNPQLDWAPIGWRGVSFSNGDIWLNDAGKIRAIRYLSPKGEKKRQALIDAERLSLHKSVNEFLEPVLQMRTASFKVRVDAIQNGTYRYAAWPIEKSYSDEPNLVIGNGKIIHKGNGGNHFFEFQNGNYLYRVHINVIGSEETLSDELTVTLEGEEIFRQEAKSVHY